jgi:hypothetical protein
LIISPGDCRVYFPSRIEQCPLRWHNDADIESRLYLFWQPNLLATSFYPRIAAHEREFRTVQCKAYSHGPNPPSVPTLHDSTALAETVRRLNPASTNYAAPGVITANKFQTTLAYSPFASAGSHKEICCIADHLHGSIYS